MGRKRLTDKQRLFIHEYPKDLNATKAAVRAGYSAKNADKIGPELLGKTRIREPIEEVVSKRLENAAITTDWILETLKENVNRSMQTKPVYDKKGDPIGQYVYNGAVANRALELLGRYRGMFSERHEMDAVDSDPAKEVSVQEPIKIDADDMVQALQVLIDAGEVRVYSDLRENT